MKLRVPRIVSRAIRAAAGARARPSDGDEGAAPRPTLTTEGSGTMFRGDSARTGCLSGAGLRALSGVPFVLIRLNLKIDSYRGEAFQGVVAAPCVFGDTLYFCNLREGAAYAVDLRSQHQHWRYQPAEADVFREQVMFAHPVLAGGAMFVATTTRVLALELSSGALRWSHDLAGGASLAASGGKLVVATRDGRVVALDPERGTERWSRDGLGEPRAALAAEDGAVYLQSAGAVRAWDAATGERRWTHAVADAPPPPAPPERFAVEPALAVAGGRVFYVHGGALVALHAAGGEPIFRYHDREVQTPAAISGDSVFVGATSYRREGEAVLPGHALVCLDAGTGAVRWEAPLEDPPRFGPIVAGDTVYVTSALHEHRDASPFRVVACDRATGQVLFTNGDFSVSSEPIVSHECLLWGTDKGTVRVVR